MTTYYKAIRPDGTSFADSTFRWLPEDGRIPTGGHLVKHPKPARHFGPHSQATASRYLSLSVEPADCTGFRWPCRLLVVEPVGTVRDDDRYPHKRRVIAARVVGEIQAWRALGPNGRDVTAFLDLLGKLSGEQWAAALTAAWAAAGAAAWVVAWDAAWEAARDAARAAAREAARGVVWAVARDAAQALVVRDMIGAEHFATLTAPMRTAGVDFDALAVTA